ncbi:MAG: YitT family protein [Clostridia bacterium]|nr:YitT family protein [Clostridia bacterium]
MKLLRKLINAAPVQYVALMVVAVAASFAFEIFVYPNAFAPSGINGFATLVQYVFQVSVGYISLLINVPMLIVAYFVIDRRYAMRNLAFIIAFGVSGVILRQIDLSSIAFHAQDGGQAIMAAIAGGFFYGLFYSFAVRLGASTGGTDILAAFINKWKPEMDTVWIIFTLNVGVAVMSFFVYGYNYNSVILCIINCYVCSRVGDTILKGIRAAAKFEVITTHPEELSKELMEKLHHGCTVVPAKGMYTQTDRSMLVCVVNRRQVVDFERIVRKYDDTFTFISTVNGTIGSFHRVK